MSGDINVQSFSGKVNISNNLLVGSSHLFVDTVNNRVGITTGSPGASLEVNGNVHVGTDLTLGGTLTGDGSGLTNVNSDSGLWAGAGTGSVYLSTSTDNVGIGTTNPKTPLEVSQSSGFFKSMYIQKYLGTGPELATSYVLLLKSESSNPKRLAGKISGVRGYSGFNNTFEAEIIAGVGSGAQLSGRMTFNYAGNSNNFYAKLVSLTYNSSTYIALALIPTANYNGISGGIYFNGNTGAIDELQYITDLGTVSNVVDFPISGGDKTTFTGNVGIGTTSPSTRLHVNHDLHLEASSEAWNTTVGKGLYLRYSLTGGQDTAYIQSIDRSNTSLSYPMIFQASSYQFSVGDVGIGKTPSEKLHVHENLSTSGHHIMARIGGDTSSYNTLVFGSKEGRPHIGGHRGDFGAWADLSFQNDLMILQQSTERVGIGVSDPDSKLEVRGNIRASFSDTNHGMFIDAGGTIRRDYGGNGVGLHFTANQIFPTNYLGSYSAGGIDLGTSTYRWNNVYTEALNASGNVTTGPVLYVGTNTNNETAKTIYFGGTYGDNAYDHCVIERRIWQTGTEKQELLLFSGNDGESTAGPDRIRLKGGQILFDTLNNSTDRTTENTKMTVKSDGVVINSGTLRKPGNPGCRVTMTGSQFTLGSGSVFPIVYNSEHHDTGNDYNTSTGKFTCPVAGKYLCIHMMTTRSSRTRVAISEVKLYHNTTETARQFQDITQDSACATNVINCAAGDTLYAGIYNADATNEFNGGTEYGSQFIVEFLG
jgi:hypothetical protein